MGNGKQSVEELVDQGIQALTLLLGSDWQVSLLPAEMEKGRSYQRSAPALVEVRSSDGSYINFSVDAKSSVSPVYVEQVLAPKQAFIRQLGSFAKILVIAPRITPRTRKMLRDNDINYLDLAGNVSLRTARPAMNIYTQASPSATGKMAPSRGKATLAGAKAGRLVRLLADVAPPYRIGNIAAVASLSLPYVSRLLSALEEQLLIRRDGRTITYVDWPNLLRERAEQVNLLRQNPYTGMLSPNGIAQVQSALRELNQGKAIEQRIAVTGSYAAREVAPLAVGGQLMLYIPLNSHGLEVLGEGLGLLQVEEGANVMFLQPSDEVVFKRSRMIDGINHVALSQLVIDCLSGPGRMPAEGEAVLNYMSENQEIWQLSELPS